MTITIDVTPIASTQSDIDDKTSCPLRAEREWICGMTGTTDCPSGGDPNCPSC